MITFKQILQEGIINQKYVDIFISMAEKALAEGIPEFFANKNGSIKKLELAITYFLNDAYKSFMSLYGDDEDNNIRILYRNTTIKYDPDRRNGIYKLERNVAITCNIEFVSSNRKLEKCVFIGQGASTRANEYTDLKTSFSDGAINIEINVNGFIKKELFDKAFIHKYAVEEFKEDIPNLIRIIVSLLKHELTHVAQVQYSELRSGDLMHYKVSYNNYSDDNAYFYDQMEIGAFSSQLSKILIKKNVSLKDIKPYINKQSEDAQAVREDEDQTIRTFFEKNAIPLRMVKIYNNLSYKQARKFWKYVYLYYQKYAPSNLLK